MKISVNRVSCSFNFDLEGFEIEVTSEEIRDLRSRVINDSSRQIKQAITEAVDEAVDKIANAEPKKAAAPKKAPAKKAPVKKAVAPNPGTPW